MSSSAPARLQFLLQPEHLRSLLVHVDAEEVSLRNTMQLLQDIPVLSADEIQQRELRVRMEQSMRHAALLLQNRCRVIHELALQLRLPDDAICFSELLPYASPSAAALIVSARNRLQRLVHQVRVLANSTAWIVQESRRIQLTVLDALPGTVSSDRYDSSGQRNLNPASFRFETRS